MTLSDNALIDVAYYARYTGANVPTGTHVTQWEQAIEVASQWVEHHTGRQFHKSDTSVSPTATARYFDAVGDKVHITDCYSVTSVATDTADAGSYTTTVTSANYQLLPQGGWDDVLGQVPYTAIKQTSWGIWPCTVRERPVKVTGLWGWSAVPTNVQRATANYAQDLLKDPDTRFSGLSVDANGVVLAARTNPRTLELLGPYRVLGRAPGLNVA